MKCYNCGKEGRIAPKCRQPKRQVNEVIPERELLTKKSDLLYIIKIWILSILDTGAGENYITRRLIERTQTSTRKLKQPEIRYTCLGEAFLVKEEANL